MDGWALGKTKVFLKYYHVEFLSKLYEDQVKKIVLVQSYVRRWLAQMRFRRERWRIAQSIITVQRYARGWITRKRVQEEKARERLRRQEAEKYEMAKARQAMEKGKAALIKAQLLRKLSSQEVVKPTKTSSESKENSNQDQAAVVIQNLRRQWGPEVEARVHQVLQTARSRSDAHTALQHEGLSAKEAADVIQRFFRTRMETLDMETERREVLAVQGRQPVELQGRRLSEAWHNALADGKHRGPHVSNKINELWANASNHPPREREEFSPASDLRKILRQSPDGWNQPQQIHIPHPHANHNNIAPRPANADNRKYEYQNSWVAESDSDTTGPFNFRQLLRPIRGPTESLRKRKGKAPPSPPTETVVGRRVVEDSPKRRANPKVTLRR